MSLNGLKDGHDSSLGDEVVFPLIEDPDSEYPGFQAPHPVDHDSALGDELQGTILQPIPGVIEGFGLDTDERRASYSQTTVLVRGDLTSKDHSSTIKDCGFVPIEDEPVSSTSSSMLVPEDDHEK